MAIGSYSTGTIAIAAGGTVATITGGSLNSPNAKAGDTLIVAGHEVGINDVTGTLTFTIDAWPYAAVVAGTAYKIRQDSPLRFVGSDAQAYVIQMLGYLNSLGPIINVSVVALVPDPSIGSDGMYAHQMTTGTWWLKSGGVWAVTTSPSGTLFPSSVGGRVTLTSGTAVMIASVASAFTVFFTPYGGGSAPLFNGSTFDQTAFTELSNLTTDNTKNPAAVAPFKIYDLFFYRDAGGVLCLGRSPAWTNSNTRGYTLTNVNGILLNTLAITNGPAALRGTYVATIASDAVSGISYIFGSVGVGGTFYVWNAFNRVDVGCLCVDPQAGYNYTGAAREAGGGSIMQVSFVRGLAEDSVFANYQNFTTLAAGPSNYAILGLGLDTTAHSQLFPIENNSAAALFCGASVSTIWNPGIGTHFVAATESGNAGAFVNTFNAQGASSVDGLSFRLRM